MNPKLTPERLARKALVYVRQSKPSQLINNQESTRLQFSLVDRARALGFQQVVIVDDDLGRTGSGLVDRPGFQRLAAEVCSGEVGAVFCVEASRLARNGRDWHLLIDVCGMVGAVVVDLDGVYDPTLTNDRLLLGMKGTISEFESNLFRQRSSEAILQKARRGELQILMSVGFCWTRSGRVEKDPDQRVQQAIELVFRKMTELGSVRQVLQWFLQENISLPAFPHGSPEHQMVWKLPGYASLHAMLTNPIYAGAYVYGRRETRTKIVEGRARKSAGHRKPQRMGGLDQRTSSRLPFLGRIRTKSIDDCREQLLPLWSRSKERAWRPSLAFWSSSVPTLWANDPSLLPGPRRPLCLQCGPRPVR
jgi:DNA invertase Pin-like site-specific DNA recombinase